MRWFLLPFLILTTGLSSSCQEVEKPGQQDLQREEKPQTVSKKPEMSITRIPVFDLVLNQQPTPIPYPVTGLQFQRNLKGAQREKNRYRPIGEAAFNPDGDLYVTFPKQDLVIAFRRPAFDLNYYGSPTYGGKGEIIKNPGRIGFVGSNMVLTNGEDGQALVLNDKAAFQNAYDLQLPNALAGPDNAFLVVSPKNPSALARVDENVKAQQRYLLNDYDPNEDDPSMVFHILENWELVAARKSGRRLYHMEANAQYIRHLNLGLDKYMAKLGGNCEIYDVRFINNQYWLLFGQLIPAQTQKSMILVLDAEARLIHFWQTPFFADGMDLHGKDMVLYNTMLGSAETYRRP